jgi:iron(III) transport system substrate-binding protein
MLRGFLTPALIEAAKKEGKLSFYSALELNTAERLARTFEAKYPGIAVRVERSGAERIFQRIAQEQGSGIKAVDVANSTDPAHYLDWKKNDWLAPYLPGGRRQTFSRPIRSIPTACTRRPAPGWR